MYRIAGWYGIFRPVRPVRYGIDIHATNTSEMLTDAFRAMINYPFTKSFMGKEKKINVLTDFSSSHKSCVKIFLK